jgi:CubicO group peptidase (beta-lactamase class C family)
MRALKSFALLLAATFVFIAAARAQTQPPALAAAVPAQTAPPANAAPPADLDSWVQRTLDTFHVPGMAVAIVKDGHLVMAKGYGVRKLGEPATADEHTLFAIGSNTKAFTASALAILVDQGKIQWDGRVRNYLPGFAMYDSYASQEMTVRDLLSHRSGLGLGEGDLLFFPAGDITADDVVHKLRYLKPASSFRSQFAYCNLCFVTAGQIVPAITGQSWSDFIHEHIFRPLGMNESNTSIRDLRPGVNFASPHEEVEGKLQPVRFDNIDGAAPAGAINSSVTDMSRWLLLQLGRGQLPGGARLFSAADSQELWSPQTIIPTGPPLPPPFTAITPNFAAYGLGFFLRDYRGHKLVTHDGGVTGQVSRVLLVPDLDLGMVILTNAESSEALTTVSYHIMDHYLGAPDMDWITLMNQRKAQRDAGVAATVKNQQSTRDTNSKPTLPLASYAGSYSDPWYGDAAISLQDGVLHMSLSHSPSLNGTLEFWQYDTFVAHWQDKTVPDAFVTFQLTPDGAIEQIKMRAVSPAADFSYDYQDLLFAPALKPPK